MWYWTAPLWNACAVAPPTPTQRRARRPTPLAPGGLRAACWLLLLCLLFAARVRHLGRSEPRGLPHTFHQTLRAAGRTSAPPNEAMFMLRLHTRLVHSRQGCKRPQGKYKLLGKLADNIFHSTKPYRRRARGPAFARGGLCELTAPRARAQDTHEITQGQGTPPVPSRTAFRRAIR